MYIAKKPHPMRGFRDGTVEYTSRSSGRKYIVEPSFEGYLLSSSGVLIYTDTYDRSRVMALIETLEKEGGLCRH